MHEKDTDAEIADDSDEEEPELPAPAKLSAADAPSYPVAQYTIWMYSETSYSGLLDNNYSVCNFLNDSFEDFSCLY